MEQTNFIEQEALCFCFNNRIKSNMSMIFADQKLIKFLAVGVVNTIAGSGIMFLLYNFFGASYWISSACSYLAGGIISFFLNKHFTFQNKQKNLRQVLLFAVNVAFCYFVAYFAAKKCVCFLLANQSEKVRENIALFAGICLYTALNYLGQRLVVFRCSEKIQE